MLTDKQCSIINRHLTENVEPRKVAAYLCLNMGLLLGEVTALRRQDRQSHAQYNNGVCSA